MHHSSYEDLRQKTFLLQFYCFLTRGFFEKEELTEIINLINKNIERLKLMSDNFKWDGRYDLTFLQIIESNDIIEKAKANLPYKQICDDKEIADYLLENSEFQNEGILLVDLKKILDIDSIFKEGYMLHDIFNGYPEKDMYSFQIDCLDYLYSAAHFYNEGYDYFNERKVIKFYDDNSLGEIQPYEMIRIQPKDEVTFRNFREAYFNIIFFVESFINSVGIDALLNGKAKTEEEENKLKGIEKVNKNGWKSYLEISVELRNQYVHSSPEKKKNSFTSEGWKNKCDEMINNKCYAVLMAFWKGCYPNKRFPIVIFNTAFGNSFKGHQGKFMALD